MGLGKSELAALGSLGLVIRLENAGLPTTADIARYFQMDDDSDTNDSGNPDGPAA